MCIRKKGFWLQKGLNLKYWKPKCFNYEVAANCKICVKRHKYETCKAYKQCSSINCSKSRKCNACAYWEEICQYVSKKYYATCSIKKEKCVDYEDLPFKYTINSKHFFLNKIKLINK